VSYNCKHLLLWPGIFLSASRLPPF